MVVSENVGEKKGKMDTKRMSAISQPSLPLPPLWMRSFRNVAVKIRGWKCKIVVFGVVDEKLGM